MEEEVKGKEEGKLEEKIKRREIRREWEEGRERRLYCVGNVG